MANKKDQPTEETPQQDQPQYWMFPNMGADMPKSAQPNTVHAATAEEAEKINHEYLDALRDHSKKETN